MANILYMRQDTNASLLKSGMYRSVIYFDSGHLWNIALAVILISRLETPPTSPPGRVGLIPALILLSARKVTSAWCYVRRITGIIVGPSRDGCFMGALLTACRMHI
jgi:hypothetical protein